jgi:hypothetical protein
LVYGGFDVSNHQRKDGTFEIPIWNIKNKRARRPKILAKTGDFFLKAVSFLFLEDRGIQTEINEKSLYFLGLEKWYIFEGELTRKGVFVRFGELHS